MKNKDKYNEAKKIVDTMVYNYDTDDYEFVSDRCKRMYSNLGHKSQIIGTLQAKADYSYIPHSSKEDLQIRLQEIEWILEKYGEFLYHSDSTWEFLQKQKEEQNG